MWCLSFVVKPQDHQQESPMSKRVVDSLAALKDLAGQEVGVSDWFTVSQERIQQFADATLDQQWIHVDVERARRESPFEAPIAHGFLTLSLLPHFMHEVLSFAENPRLGVNYGLNRLRFVSPVRSGAKVRARFKLLSLKDVEPDGVQAVYEATVEAENSQKPSCVAEWVVRYYR
jgi:acyl dehydratase